VSIFKCLYHNEMVGHKFLSIYVCARAQGSTRLVRLWVWSPTSCKFKSLDGYLPPEFIPVIYSRLCRKTSHSRVHKQHMISQGALSDIEYPSGFPYTAYMEMILWERFSIKFHENSMVGSISTPFMGWELRDGKFGKHSHTLLFPWKHYC